MLHTFFTKQQKITKPIHGEKLCCTMHQKPTDSMGKANVAHIFTEAAKNDKICSDIVFVVHIFKEQQKIT